MAKNEETSRFDERGFPLQGYAVQPTTPPNKDGRFDERGFPAPPSQNNKPAENKPKAPAPKNAAKKFNVGVSKGGVPFKDAFRHFKDKGNKTFTWNDKKYNTVTEDEEAAAEKAAAKKSISTDKPAKKSFRQKRADRLKSRIASDSGTEGQKKRRSRRLARVERRMARNKADGGEVKGYYAGGSSNKSSPKSAGRATRGWGVVTR